MDHDSDSLVVSDQYDMDEGTRMQDQKKGTTAINALNALLEAEENIVPMAAAKSKFNSRVDLVNGHTLGSESDSSSYDEVVDDIPEHALEIRIRPNSELRDFPVVDYNSIISEVVEIFKEHGVTKYAVIRGDGVEEELTFDELFNSPGGQQALDEFDERRVEDISGDNPSGSEIIMVTTRTNRKTPERPGFVDLSSLNFSEDEEDEILRPSKRSSSRQKSRRKQAFFPEDDDSSGFGDEGEEDGYGRRTRRTRRAHAIERNIRSSRATKNPMPLYDDSLPASPGAADNIPRKRGRPFSGPLGPPRRSGRETKGKNMREVAEDDIPEIIAQKSLLPKVTGAKEAFKKLPNDNEFKRRHLQMCDTCNGTPDDLSKGFLVYCQGCTLAYHVACLGPRNGREHVVTKIGDGDFVLQCRRCVETARKKDRMAPHHGSCAICSVPGPSCRPFRPHKTPREEQKERELNNGVDPITQVSSTLVNNPVNVLFRCVGCQQAYHMHHLPPKVDEHNIIETQDDTAKAKKRLSEYSETWLCEDCEAAPADVGGLVAWRPIDIDSYQEGKTVEEVPEDDKEYLIKWNDKSYYRSTWKKGGWVWGKTAPGTRKAFARRDDLGNFPKMRIEDAIPEDYLRVDIVFDVKYNNKVSVEIEEVDRARIKEVKLAMVKYKGLGYEDAVWEEPPPSDDLERFADFKIAYEDWVRGKYMHVLAPETLQKNTRKVRAMNFEERVLQSDQPKSLKGGDLMQHQQEGLNWLLYKWYSCQNGILADEMGLGKTIQIIAFMATLQEKFNLCPFLIVVPNATCANWRREIKQWAPGLRVATFFGSAAARDLAQRYELFPRKDKTLRCHVVVTSYDAAQDENCQRIFKRINWTALVVDEGQRLKNDKNLLYHALNNLKVSFTALLTGTPIQNNPRELFNLLAFLDKNLDATQLDEENKELTQEKVQKVHEMLKSFILRRTKTQTLKDLPPMAQIIVPITMSPLQKKLYKSILGKNANLLKSIFDGSQQSHIKGLRNILMQLRQCLCHPYVYDQAIEGRTEDASSHRQLVEASAKLQILDIMLPKLKERGHRVLIFSQFLHMLTIVEDFLSGLGLEHLRLDGTMGSLQKQTCIDAFNAPGSEIFALLLSTRAGGVGINLATADTVIIMDPDFNPHQDIQAISRAHRLGQQKKVLVFQLMTRMSAEEKILQIGKKKMALDHVLIDQMDRDEEDGKDLESVLRFGAEALFKDDIANDIRYDSVSVDKLLDRSQVEDTEQGKDTSAESSFSFARVWQNDSSAMTDANTLGKDILQENGDVWQKIMEERQRHADETREKEAQNLGRGKRTRKNVDYGNQITTGNEAEPGYVGEPDFDPDFQAHMSSEGDEEEDLSTGDVAGDKDLGDSTRQRSGGKPASPRFQQAQSQAFKRAKIRPALPSNSVNGSHQCLACNNRHGSHEPGFCPLKLAGCEVCNLCSKPHYGTPGSCAVLRSEELVRSFYKSLNKSLEGKQLIAMAKRQLRNDLSAIVQDRKRKRDTNTNREFIAAFPGPSTGVSNNPIWAFNNRTSTATLQNGHANNVNLAATRISTGQNGQATHMGYASNSTLFSRQNYHAPQPSHPSAFPPYVSGSSASYFGIPSRSPYRDQNTPLATPQHFGMPNISWASTDTQMHGLPRPTDQYSPHPRNK